MNHDLSLIINRAVRTIVCLSKPHFGPLGVAVLVALQLAATPASAGRNDVKATAQPKPTKVAPSVSNLVKANCRIYSKLGWEIGRNMAMRDGHPDPGAWKGPRNPSQPCKP